ncbi:hypothetical protein PV325_008517 [Microctonus aethiopoides]|nr:hypothetical protein PV325_008517 [Microctonus aethiopoides]
MSDLFNLAFVDWHHEIQGTTANVALCIVNKGYKNCRAQRGRTNVRLPLSSRTLCAPGPVVGPHAAGGDGGGSGGNVDGGCVDVSVGNSGGGGHVSAQHQYHQHQRDHTPTPTHGQAFDEANSAVDEPMVHMEGPIQAGTWICCVPCHWLKQSKAVHKALLTLAMLLVTSLLVTSPVLFLITTLPDGDQPRDCAPLDDACVRERGGRLDGVCETKTCHEASRRMLASMNRDVDPCNDFYQFACGSFRDREYRQFSSSFGSLQRQVDRKIQTLLANETGKMVGTFEKLGHFYSSCITHGEKNIDFTPVYHLLEKLGSYLPPKSSAPSDITSLVATLLKVNGAPLFDLYLDIDFHDHSKMSVFLDLPSKHLTDSFTEKQSAGEEQRCQRIERIIQGFLPENMEKRERSYETYLLMQFCLALSKIYPRQKDLYNWVDVDQRVYIPYNLTYLQNSFGYIRWRTLLNSTLNTSTSHNLYDNDIQSNDRLVYVYVTAPRVVHNGLLFLYAVDYLHDIINVTASDNWNVTCSKMTQSVFSEILGAVYVQQYKPQYLEVLSSRVNNLFERIKETLAERILVMSWLDDETRAKVILKLTELQGKFDVWHGFYDNGLLAREMAEVTIEPDNFFINMIKRFRKIRQIDGLKLRKSMNDRWYNPYAVNAYYESSTNSIVIPLALMAAWSWSWEDGPAYAAHATLGSVIAHEILHAFDLHRHSPLDSNLTMKDWLWFTPESWNRLEAKVECIAKHHARRFWRKVQFYGDQVNVQFDWNVTRNENVADIGAIQISYQMWHMYTNGRDLTLPKLEALRPSQLFFISAAQIYCLNITAEAYILSVELGYHTPSPERVNIVMMNSPAFAEAFRCSAGTRMNPSNKCSTCQTQARLS